MRIRLLAAFILAFSALHMLVPAAQSQSAPSQSPPAPPLTVGVISQTTAQDPPNYERPPQSTLLHVYAFDMIGPYPIAVAAATAGLHQAEDSPSAWGQGFKGYATRFGSGFGIGAVETTARYALAKAVGEDTLYYECQCKGIGPRLRHALISSFTGRRGDDGHRVISFASIAAPYAGTFTAVYAWYPRSYGAGDALRMGTYSLLGYVGGNISLEFLYGGPHSLLARAHLPVSTTSPKVVPSEESKP